MIDACVAARCSVEFEELGYGFEAAERIFLNVGSSSPLEAAGRTSQGRGAESLRGARGSASQYLDRGAESLL